MKKLLILSLILSIFNIGKVEIAYGSAEPVYGVFHPLIDEISRYADKLSSLNNNKIIQEFYNLKDQIKLFAIYHRNLLLNISTNDVKIPFNEFDKLIKTVLEEATLRIYTYSKNPDLSAEPEIEIHKSIDDIKGLFHTAIKDILSFQTDNKSVTSFHTARLNHPTHLYALIQFCLTKDELIPLLPEDIFQEENTISTLKLVNFYLENLDEFGISFEDFLHKLNLYDKFEGQPYRYNQKILHAFFNITHSKSNK